MDRAKFDTIKKQVEYCLKTFEDTRNSDITLMIKVWEVFYPNKVRESATGSFIHLKSLYDLPREDHIKRIRAQFNSEGKYYPTVREVAERRNIEEEEWLRVLGYKPKEQKAAL